MPRAGVVGPGSIGRLHVKTLRSLGVPVRALVASSPESARAHADRLQIPQAYDSVAAMAGSGEVDVVHICTPNVLHAAGAAAAIEAGCSLVCEKPLTFDLAQADDLLARVERASARGGVCYHYRYFQGVVEAGKLLRSGALGGVRLLCGRYLSQELLEVPAGHWLADAAVVGPARSLADVGIHWFDLTEHLTGQPVEAVLAEPAGAEQGEPLLHGAAVTLRLSGGATATVVVSQDCVGAETDEIVLEVHGSTGRLRWSLGDDGEQLSVWRTDGLPPTCKRYATSFEEGTRRAFEGLMRDLYAGIERRTGSAPTIAEGRHGVAILDAAVKSAQSGCWAKP
ncbi:MAG: Gfo/Idh/MocA family oxidoreductase [Solirubrobacteraceae bacterium]